MPSPHTNVFYVTLRLCDVLRYVQTMSTRQYNSENRRWSFHVKEYETLMNKIGDLRSEIYIEALPRSVMQVRKAVYKINLFMQWRGIVQLA